MASIEENIWTDRGLATFGPAGADLLDRLDEVFKGWALRTGAVAMLMPPLLPVADLAKFDFYQNFPQLALVATGIDPAEAATATSGEFPTSALAPAALGLPSTVCYPVYRHFAGEHLSDDMLVTVFGLCFRNEDHYDGLRRLMAFRMREAVALGSLEFTQRHLDRATEFITAFAEAIDLPISRQAASDPFFDSAGPRAMLQRLVPVKHEFVFNETAIASVNLHRNFFGERCGIGYGERAESAFTSCVGFGYDRWVHSLAARYEGDWNKIIKVVDRACTELP